MKDVSNKDNLDNSDDSNNQKHVFGFMFYKDPQEEDIIEWCPHCEEEVEIKGIAQKQTCPVCGEDILPCSLCNHNYVNCNKCIIK